MCHYNWQEKANVLNCSNTNITSLRLQFPNGTNWLIAKSNHIPQLDWSKNLSNIEHFDLQNSCIQHIANDFVFKIQTMKKAKFLNLANNYLRSFPKSLKGTNFSEVYLAGNPIDCNCHMLWFAEWLNTTEPKSQNRIVKDYDQVLCMEGQWNGTQVYKLSAELMGCLPIPK